MRLKKFQVKNYCSIVDSEVVELSENDNVSAFVGQNESGKSSLLQALYAFERGIFEDDAIPFSTGQQKMPIVSCTYKVEAKDDIAKILTDIITNNYNDAKIKKKQKILCKNSIKKIKEFTITKTREDSKVKTTIDEISFKIFQSSILERQKSTEENKKMMHPQANKNKAPEKPIPIKEKYIDITDEQNSDVAALFRKCTPKIVFFDDFCDLLPNKIFISDLKAKNKDTEGYRAVRNLEQILETNFVTKHNEVDPIRITNQDRENDDLSVDFQKDWGQRIHDNNKVVIEYDFEKRNGRGRHGSYINFYVKTKEGQRLPPKQRSKGLIWFLSLWLELRAQGAEPYDLLLLLDEPDQHLHVKAQKDILNLINKLSRNTDEDEKVKKIDKKSTQIFYATHSPYLIEADYLNRIKLVLNDEKEGTKVEDIVTSKINTKYKKDALQPIANAMNLSVSEFSSPPNNNIILEGISDFYYFHAMKKILSKSGNYTFIPGIGVRQINNLISMSIGHGLSWIAIIDDDPIKGGRDSKKKFDEIRDFVFDGDNEKTKEKVHILDGVVGIENMFTIDDLKLIDPGVNQHNDKAKVVGRKKVFFAKNFFEKVNKKEIKKENISSTAITKFEKVFDFIDKNFVKAKA